MSNADGTNPRPDADNAAAKRRRERLLQEFEAAWEQGDRPTIGRFWPAEEADRLALLVELARADLAHRLKGGEPARVETYLESYPELAADRGAALGLIVAEYDLRREQDPTLKVEEYFQRFPEYREELVARFAGPVIPQTVPGAPVPKPLPVILHTEPGAPVPSPNPLIPQTAPGAPVPAPSLPSSKPRRATSARSRSESKPPWPRIAGYEILGELGRGGMGVVYKGRQIGLNRVVALKMILGGVRAGSEEVARFRIEAEAVARMQHPNIVQIHAVGEHEGLPFFSLEYCAGGSLASRLDGAPLPPFRAAGLVEVLARAIHAAHLAGIVHRDLKPANVLLRPVADHLSDPPPGEADLEDLVPKITDFGLAKKLDDPGQTRSGAIMGTPSYMAPEQASGRVSAIGPTTDVYALAAILYELLTGRPPFRGATQWDTIEQVVKKEPVPPRELQPGTPRDLETICLKGLRKEQGRRYGSARELAEDLQRWLEGRPIQARAVTAWERTWKWGRRRPTATALVGVAVLAVCAFVAATVLYARNQSQQASIYKQELKKVQEQEEVRERGSRTLLLAQQHEAAGQWAEANLELAKAQEALDAQPELAAEELRAEVQRRQAVVRARLQEEEQRRQARQRLQAFQAPYDNALFYEMVFTGLDLTVNRDKTRENARTALALYGLDESADPAAASPLLEGDRSLLGADEHARLVGGCYELLLIWAEAEAAPAPGRPDAEEQGRARAETALSLLTRAERLGRAYGLDTRAYHLRKARFLAQSKGEAFDPAAVEKTVPALPTGPLDWFLEGLDRYRTGQYEAAGEACREALRRQGTHFWARYVQALCLLRAGRWVEAKAELTICANQRSEFVWPKLLRGFAASELGALHTKEQLAAGEFQAAEEDFDSALKEDPDPLVQYVGLVNRGVLNIRRRRWDEAARDLQAAVNANPAGFQGYCNLAQALEGEGKSDEAVAALDRAVALAPNLEVPYESRAKLLLLHGRRAEARADFERAVALAPGDGPSKRLVEDLLELGRLRHREGQYEEALANYNRALRLKPDFLLTERFRADTLLALHREAEAGQALDRYLDGPREAAEEVPAEVYQDRGLIYAAAGKLPQAVEMYTLALRQNPRDAATRRARGWAYLMTDAALPALEDFETCVNEDKTDADALIGRGNARVRLKQLEGALEDARAAEEQGPLTGRLQYNLTRLYAQEVGQLETESRTAPAGSDWLGARRALLCRTKALDSLLRTLEEEPQEKRAAFWGDEVQADPALAPIRDGARYLQMAALYARGAP